MIYDLIWVLVVRGPRGMWLVNYGFELFVIWNLDSDNFCGYVNICQSIILRFWNYRLLIWDANLRATKKIEFKKTNRFQDKLERFQISEFVEN